jgi:hypothetical protein
LAVASTAETPTAKVVQDLEQQVGALQLTMDRWKVERRRQRLHAVAVSIGGVVFALTIGLLWDSLQLILMEVYLLAVEVLLFALGACMDVVRTVVLGFITGLVDIVQQPVTDIINGVSIISLGSVPAMSEQAYPGLYAFFSIPAVCALYDTTASVIGYGIQSASAKTLCPLLRYVYPSPLLRLLLVDTLSWAVTSAVPDPVVPCTPTSVDTFCMVLALLAFGITTLGFIMVFGVLIYAYRHQILAVLRIVWWVFDDVLLAALLYLYHRASDPKLMEHLRSTHAIHSSGVLARQLDSDRKTK